MPLLLGAADVVNLPVDTLEFAAGQTERMLHHARRLQPCLQYVICSAQQVSMYSLRDAPTTETRTVGREVHLGRDAGYLVEIAVWRCGIRDDIFGGIYGR